MQRTYTSQYANSIVGVSPAILKLRSLIRDAASTDMTILILGETGVGKELVARSIHDESNRKGAYVTINCAAIPEGLLESELFGYRKGAFTSANLGGNPGAFRYAEGGTVFLDEILDMVPAHQAKLLRFLQEKEIAIVGNPKSPHVNVRVVAATNKDLEYELKKGGLRPDLYYRLNGFTIEVPPLRERLSDLPLLVRNFIAKYGNLDGLEISPEVIEKFKKHKWPGNVRELENYVKRAVLAYERQHQSAESRPKTLTKEYFESFYAKHTKLVPGYGVERTANSSPVSTNGIRGDTHSSVLKSIARRAKDEVETQAIKETLERVRWNRSAAAKLLGISYKGLLLKIDQLGLKSDS